MKEEAQTDKSGFIILPNHERYDEKRKVWNNLIDRYPAAIFECLSEADVISAVSFAKKEKMDISVRSGGHHLAGTAVCEEGVMLDLSKMNSVTVDKERQVATVEAGAMLGDIDSETQKLGLATPTGTVSETGIGGLALGGGFGYLRGKYGLTCDNILSAKMVTADGKLIKVSNDEHTDLFWAIRGGGGNFGVVTSFELQLYPVGPNVMAIDIMYDYKDAKEIFQKLDDYMNNAPDEISVNSIIMQLPPAPFLPESMHGKRVIAVSGMYTGELTHETEEAFIEPLQELAIPLMDNTGKTAYTDLQKKLDQMVPQGAEIVGTSLFFKELDEAMLNIIFESIENSPLPMAMAQIWMLNGRMNRVSADETAFAVRDARFLVLFDGEIVSGDPVGSQEWMDSVYNQLLPYSYQKTSYLNGVKLGEEITRNTYGDNYFKLAKIKRVYDPENLFCYNHNIAPE
ncbi:FAD/FMN-containing dehydrogenase [Virgibacillus subterraneus]|uniref:FAD/FMN-containing dehydrogenase n=1 Tax=Virgibacillus subterraneus TaxID=621109 RepID=A0A1H9BEW0_9BACI|nr:FAD-binding oxidoreductase [Virgibacillus subterraneus]SEP87532.1 FAD/FMN-containing dehydrogenase [Virgibacillus subterraneus]